MRNNPHVDRSVDSVVVLAVAVRDGRIAGTRTILTRTNRHLPPIEARALRAMWNQHSPEPITFMEALDLVHGDRQKEWDDLQVYVTRSTHVEKM